jgi:hypothetical protein
MSYNVRKTNGETIQVPDLVIDKTTNINLVGRGLPHYGEPIAENLVRMLENFSSPVAPGSSTSSVDGDPLTGQLWFDSASKTMKFYNGNRFVSIIDEDDPIGGSGSSDKLTTPRQIQLSGQAEGSTLFDGSQNVTIDVSNVEADRLKTPIQITLTGDATGSATFDGSSDITINTSVSVEVPGSVEEAERLKTARRISLSGDVTGFVDFDGSSDVDISTDIGSNFIRSVLLNVYPIGSIYMSMSTTNPATLFGFGTWAAISGRFLVGRDTTQNTNPRFDIVGGVGGSLSHSHADGTLSAVLGGAHDHIVSNEGWGAIQGARNSLAKPTTSGKLVTGSGRSELGEDLESLAHANNDIRTSNTESHTHDVLGDTSSTTTVPPYFVVNIWRRTA